MSDAVAYVTYVIIFSYTRSSEITLISLVYLEPWCIQNLSHIQNPVKDWQRQSLSTIVRVIQNYV